MVFSWLWTVEIGDGRDGVLDAWAWLGISRGCCARLEGVNCSSSIELLESARKEKGPFTNWHV